MAIAIFGVVTADISAERDGFDLTKHDAKVTEKINQFAAPWNVQLRAQGLDPAAVEARGAGDDLYETSKLYIILRTAAWAGKFITHQDGALSEDQDEEADKLLKLLHRKPEAFSGWDRNENRGANRADTLLKKRTAGTRVRRPCRAWNQGTQF